jgi:hypothetical protein
MKAAITLTTILAMTALQGCAVPSATLTDQPVARMTLSTRDEPAGNTLVEVSTYQFVPDARAMDKACREALANKVGYAVPIDKVKIVHDRNVWSGISSCKASL